MFDNHFASHFEELLRRGSTQPSANTTSQNDSNVSIPIRRSFHYPFIVILIAKIEFLYELAIKKAHIDTNNSTYPFSSRFVTFAKKLTFI
jgi:hypothetical protein